MFHFKAYYSVNCQHHLDISMSGPELKGDSKKWAGFDRQRPISMKGAGIQNN